MDTQESIVLCEKCYLKVILFYKFKTLALKTESYFKTQSHTANSFDEVFEPGNVKCEIYSDNNSSTSFLNDDLKEEDNISLDSSENQSENKYLIVVPKIDDTNLSDESVPEIIDAYLSEESEETGECQNYLKSSVDSVLGRYIT